MTTPANPTRKRFGMLALLFVSVLVNYMDRANMSVAGTSLREDLGLSMVQMGLVFSAFGWTYSFLQLPGGVVVDTFRTRPLYSAIMGLWSIATVAQGLANSLLVLLGCRMSIGVFEAPSYPANNKIVTSWFPDGERATAISIYTSGQFIGLAVLAPVLVWIQTHLGWRGMFFVTGGAGLVWAAVMYWLYRDPLDHPTANAEELQYIRQGGGHPDGVPREDTKVAPRRFELSDLREAVVHRKLWGVYLGQYCLGALFIFFLTWFPTYLQEARGLSLDSIGWWASVPYLGAFVGVLLSGFLSDYLLRRGWSPGAARKTPVLCGMLLMSTIVAANYTSNITWAVMFMTVAFFGNGLASITWVFISSIAPVRSIGMVGGVFNFIGSLSAATVPTIIGWLAQEQDFESALVFIAVLAAVGFFSYLLLVGKVERIEV